MNRSQLAIKASDLLTEAVSLLDQAAAKGSGKDTQPFGHSSPDAFDYIALAVRDVNITLLCGTVPMPNAGAWAAHWLRRAKGLTSTSPA